MIFDGRKERKKHLTHVDEGNKNNTWVWSSTIRKCYDVNYH